MHTLPLLVPREYGACITVVEVCLNSSPKCKRFSRVCIVQNSVAIAGRISACLNLHMHLKVSSTFILHCLHCGSPPAVENTVALAQLKMHGLLLSYIRSLCTKASTLGGKEAKFKKKNF